MWLKNFLKSRTAISSPRRPARRRQQSARLCLEAIEDRSLPSFGVPVDVGTDQPSTPGIGWYPQSVVAADFNGDGRLDLATALRLENTITVALGNGDGTFRAPRTTACTDPWSIQAGDLNADGKADLVVLNNSAGVRVLLGNGDGTFRPPQVITVTPQVAPGNPDLGPLPQAVSAVAIGDFNGDGRLDLVAEGANGYRVVSGYNEDGSAYYDYYGYSYANVLLGSGDGTLLPTGVVPAAPLSPDDGDFNNDGRLDLLTAAGVLPGNGDGTFGGLVLSAYSVSLGGASHPVGDFNDDGNLDVLSADFYTHTPTLMLGNGDGTFRPGGALYPDLVGDLSFIATGAGDVNGDGKLDIVAIPGEYDYADWSTTRSMRVLLGNGDGSFAPVVAVVNTFPGIGYLTSAVLADFDGDGLPDLATSDVYAVNDADPGVYRGPFVARNDGIWTVPPPPPPAISISDVTVVEGNTGTRAASFTVTLSAAYGQPVSVSYATANDTATAGSDYQAASGTFTFAPGETSKTISVLVNGDRLAEPNEMFFVNLSRPTNATIVDSQGVGTIIDDEPRISISDVSKSEGKKGQTTLFTFTVTLSAAYDQAVTMSFRTADGTATTGDADYVAKTGTITFAPGETTKTVTVTVNGDSKKEATEYFYLDLFGNSSNSLFTKGRGTGTILNDD